MNTILIEYVQEKLHRIEEEMGYGYTLCCESSYHALHAVPNIGMCEEIEHDEAFIEAAFRQYFEIVSFYNGEVNFNILPEQWERLERKMKIQHILS